MANANFITQFEYKLNNLTGSETQAELLALRATSDKYVDDLNSGAVALLDAAIDADASALTNTSTIKELVTVGNADAEIKAIEIIEVGQIVQTTRNTTSNGNALLPLGVQGRILTPAEELLYPQLAASLEDLPAITHHGQGGGTGLSLVTVNAQEFAVLADGNQFYYGKDPTLYRYTRTTDSFTTVKSHGASDLVKALGCSGDGTVVAYILWDSSQVKYHLYVSTDSGGSFFLTASGTAGAAGTDLASLHITPDGSTITAILPDASAGFRYVRIDSPATALVLAENKLIEGNLSIPATGNSRLYANFSDDGQTVVVTHFTENSTDELSIEYSENACDTFTRINTYPFDVIRASTVSTLGDAYVALDAANPTNLFAWMGRSGNQGLFHSEDKGISWNYIQHPAAGKAENIGGTSLLGGWLDWYITLMRPRYRNGIVQARDDQGFQYVIHIKDGKSQVLDRVKPSRNANQGFLDVGWAADESSFAVSGTVENGDLGYTGTIFTIGKYLPPVEFNSNQKIVADEI